MKFQLENKTKDNPASVLRRLGYHFLQKTINGQLDFVKALGQDSFPRFHLYLKLSEDRPQTVEKFEFNLHLDQRRPRYKGQTAHNADYAGQVVEKEVERIKQAFV